MSVLSLDTTSLNATSNLMMSLCGKFSFAAKQNIVSGGGTVTPGSSNISETIPVSYELPITIAGNSGDDAGYTYQNNDLKGAVQLNSIILNDSVITRRRGDKGDFTFNATTGVIDYTPNKFYGDDYLLIRYSKYVNIAATTEGTINTIITFTNVATYDLEWTAAYIAKYGNGADFSVEILINGVYRVVTCEIIPDSITNTTSYHFDFGGVSTGRIIF